MNVFELNFNFHKKHKFYSEKVYVCPWLLNLIWFDSPRHCAQGPILACLFETFGVRVLFMSSDIHNNLHTEVSQRSNF